MKEALKRTASLIAADSITDDIRRIILWSENKLSANPALAGRRIWNSQIQYNLLGFKDNITSSSMLNYRAI